MRPRRFGGLMLLAAYTATALVSAFVAVRLTARGSAVSVPPLVGMDLEQVRGNVSRKGLEIEIIEEKWSDLYPAGAVISQSPAANTRTKRGRRIKLTLSRGSKILDMPDLAGRPLDEARFLLRQSGLRISGVSSVPSAAGKGSVMAQEPARGREVARDYPVKVLVSSGPAAPSFAIPHVRGMSTPEALVILREAGLKIKEVAKVTSTAFAAGTVLAQEPPGGWRATPGDEVRLRAVMGHSAVRNTRYVPLKITAPAGQARRIRVIIVDESGRREVANEIVAGGKVLRLPTRVTGDAVAQIFIAGTLVMEKRL